ncbi:hypothetical protein ACJJTC_002780 [Scirpophaga incertulas]
MFLTPPAKIVNTRSTVRRDRETLEKDEMPQQQNKTVITQTPASSVKMESHPPPKVSSAAASSRSRKSTTSLEARRKKLMLKAERKKAEIRVQLIDKDLEADLANLEEYSSHDGGSSARHDVESWIYKSQMELDKLVVPEYGPKMDDPSPPAAGRYRHHGYNSNVGCCSEKLDSFSPMNVPRRYQEPESPATLPIIGNKGG